MAGGEGTRLRPLTSNQPKPMVPIVGKPCMEHILELLREHGFTDVVVTVAFMPQAIRSYFGNGENLGAQHRVLGRGEPARHRRLGPARVATASTRPASSSPVTRSATSISARSSSSTRSKGAAVTIGLKSVENPLEFGIVVTDDDGRVERFLEKPSWGQVFSDTINTGIYVLEPEVLRHIPTDRPFDFSKELFPLLLEMGRPIYGYVCEGYWQDIGNLDQYRQANFDALDEKVALNISGSEDPRRRVGRGGSRDRRRRRRRGPGVHRQLLHDLARVVGRAVLGARSWHHAPRARTRRALRDRLLLLHRTQRTRRGRDPRPQLRRAVTRARPRRRRDRRPGDARRPVRHLSGRAHLPVQGGRVRRADPRERDLGVARHDPRLRQGRRARPRQRRSDARGGDPASVPRSARRSSEAHASSRAARARRRTR